MAFEPLDPKVTLRLLEGHPDVLSKPAEDRANFYASVTCVRCGSDATKPTGWDGSARFVNGDILPRSLIECESCECIFDPHTNLIVRLGNMAKAYEPAFPIIDPKD